MCATIQQNIFLKLSGTNGLTVNSIFNGQSTIIIGFLVIFNDLLSFCLLIETILKPDLEDLSLNFLCGGDSVH